MGYKGCPHCGKTMTDDGAPCPSCHDTGVITTPPQKSRAIGYIILFGALTIVALVAAGMLSNTPPADSMAATIGDGPRAALICRQFVTERLRAPKTAEFSSLREATIERVDDSWRVRAYVDSQNGFGALLRTNYTCRVSFQPATNQWRLDALETAGR